MLVFGIVVVVLLVLSPLALAVWVGTRVRLPVLAFMIAWGITPVASYVATVLSLPVLRAITPPDNDGTGVIMIPFIGIVTGLIAGAVAATIMSRLGDREVKTSQSLV